MQTLLPAVCVFYRVHQQFQCFCLAGCEAHASTLIRPCRPHRWRWCCIGRQVCCGLSLTCWTAAASIPGHEQNASLSTAQMPSGSTSPSAAQPASQMPSSSATPLSPSAAPTESMGEPSQDPEVFATANNISLDSAVAIKSGSRYHEIRTCNSLISGAKSAIRTVAESTGRQHGLTPCRVCSN